MSTMLLCMSRWPLRPLPRPPPFPPCCCFQDPRLLDPPCTYSPALNIALGDTPSSSTDTDRVHRRSTDADRVHRRSTGSTDGQRGPQTVNGRRQGPQTASMIHGQPDYRSATTCSQQTATRPTGRWLQGPEPISTKIPWTCVHYRHIATTLWPTHTYSNVLIMNAPAENYHRTPEWICVYVSIYIHLC